MIQNFFERLCRKITANKTEIKFQHFHAIIILIIIPLIMYGDILFGNHGLILSLEGTDTFHHFIYWRDFGFHQLKQGIFPLWNMHLFSGAPYFAGFQSALLYPINWIYLFLPLDIAINTSIVLHVFLIGLFMYLWTSNRGLHPLACILSSLLIMFSSPNIMHIYAGHLIDLSTMAWSPLLFLIIDKIFSKPNLKICLLGIFVVTMQILGGNPQYFYYTALTVAIYSALCLFKTQRRFLPVLSIVCIYTGAIALSAIQILTAFHAASESVRSGGVSFVFASMFSFPPENLITLFAPQFFGDMETISYWGRCYLFTMTLFIGIGGFSLAIYGIVYGKLEIRRYSLSMVLILLVLALGVHTPLFQWLYQWLPGFNYFRGTSKFIFPLTIFLIMLAGIGLDHLIKNKYQNIINTVILFMIGILLLGLSFLISSSIDGTITLGVWKNMLNFISATRESYLLNSLYTNPQFIYKSSILSSKALMNAALICLFLSVLFFFTKHHKVFIYLIALFTIAEILTFAGYFRPAFDILPRMKNELTKFIQEHPGDHRILNIENPNSAMSIGAKDIWGYDPGVPLRYAQFMNFTQGLNPDNATQYLNFKKHHRLFSMIRCRYIFVPKKDKVLVTEITDPMHRIHLISHWQVINRRDDIFKEMEKQTFDPRQTVILETSPNIKPIQNDNIGECTIENSSTNYLTIKGKLEQPALLLITDSYSKGWQVKPLTGSSQQSYIVMPANYTLMAIPLSAGEHHLRLEYKPISFVVGKWISLSALIIYLMLIIIAVRNSAILQNCVAIHFRK